jgi:hypothetical protein
MPSRNPLAGVVPKVEHRADVDEAAIVEQIEKIEGEIAVDAYVKGLMANPEVAERITELEICLQRLANAVLALPDINRRTKLRAVAEEAARVLKNRLEVADLTQRVKQRVRSRLGAFEDELRMTKP